jgi:hypothetical protein
MRTSEGHEEDMTTKEREDLAFTTLILEPESI